MGSISLKLFLDKMQKIRGKIVYTIFGILFSYVKAVDILKIHNLNKNDMETLCYP